MAAISMLVVWAVRKAGWEDGPFESRPLTSNLLARQGLQLHSALDRCVREVNGGDETLLSQLFIGGQLQA